MKRTKSKAHLLAIPLFICIILSALSIRAQVAEFDSTGLKIIRISHADSVVGMNEEKINYQRLIGTVVIEHDGFTMTCDSAHLYMSKNYVEAFSNVNITKANGVNAHSDYIKYTGNNNTAYMKGGVQIIDGSNTLNTEELTYNIKTKIGKYFKTGSIQTEETTISSDEGTYNGYSQQTYFRKNVIVTNPKYTIESKELTYNIKSKVTRILDQSTIVSDNSTIYCKNGSYDSKTGNAVFTTRTTVVTDEQTIIGNKLTYNDKSGNATATGNVIVIDEKNDTKLFADKADYNKKSGDGKATGHVVIEQDSARNLLYAHEAIYNKLNGYVKTSGDVIIIDTLQKSTLKAGIVEFNENSNFMLATLYPKLTTLADEDSTFMRADTMMSIRIRDRKKLALINLHPEKKGEKPVMVYNLLYADSTFKSLENEDEKKIVIANRNVKIFSDSMQAVCDSLVYNQYDSTYSLYKQPVLWSKNQQGDADTVILHTVNNQIQELNLINNAFLLSLTGYDTYYDQVSGSYIDAYFEKNEINQVHVNQNAETIYYGKDDDGAFLGSNKSESSEMTVYFINKELQRIVGIENPKNVGTPIDKETDKTKFLSSFRLLTERKPKSKFEILND
ncbi:MAG: LPS export ABC transporter periplasmic protein LptC [Chitinophagaceae bacterium]|nr:LPS export ABC transporter periplasmic protein LptC [Chitinophagaceae bacterium]